MAGVNPLAKVWGLYQPGDRRCLAAGVAPAADVQGKHNEAIDGVVCKGETLPTIG